MMRKKDINKYYKKAVKQSKNKYWVMACGICAIGAYVWLSFNINNTDVLFAACVDGDTAKLYVDGVEETVRFLAIDTPETKHPTKGEEPYGKQASEFTCNALKKAAKITLEYDNDSDVKDKYDRILAWVIVDDVLLQKELVTNGLAKVDYLYGDYKYTDVLYKAQDQAKANKVNIWSSKE